VFRDRLRFRVTDPDDRGQFQVVAAPPLLLLRPAAVARDEAGTVTLEELYDRHADYVYKSLRRLGVPHASLPDALQDVFVVVHRRLSELEPCRSAKPWLFVLAMGVARNHRRRWRRKAPEHEHTGVDPDRLGGRVEEAFERAVHAERIEHFYKLLEALDDDKRAVFVLAELEELTVPEIASTLGLNLNTAYARLRAARQRFEQALSRLRAREQGLQIR
jgi:RNA polymerase sigma-70 factor (ECF subfamily)